MLHVIEAGSEREIRFEVRKGEVDLKIYKFGKEVGVTTMNYNDLVKVVKHLELDMCPFDIEEDNR